MEYDGNSMDISVTESESYTPRHNYNTRLSAKLSNSSLPKIFEERLRKGPYASLTKLKHPAVGDRDLVPKSRKKTDFDDSFELCVKKHEVLTYRTHIMGWQERSYTCSGPCAVNCSRPPPSSGRCPSNEFWNKYSKYIFVAALVGMIIIPMLNNIFQTFLQLTQDVEQLKVESNAVKLKLQNIDSSVSLMKKGSFNIKSMVLDEMDKLNSDKTGRTDYALESTGGSIVTLLPGTENFSKPKNLFGMTLCEGSHGPRAMIQLGTAPGQCWAFKGGSGGAIIKLVGLVNIDSISLEHIPKQMSPTGEISTAPKDFVVVALRTADDTQGSYLGQFKYDINGPALQTFEVESTFPVEYVSFKVLSNNGHVDFTCVYRLRIHGTLNQASSNK